MSAKKTSGAVMISLIVHGAVFFIAGIYLVTQTQQFRDRFGAEVLQAKEPPKPQVRKPIFKPIKPAVPTTSTVIAEPVQVKQDHDSTARASELRTARNGPGFFQ